jgi:hypothetical protein
MKVLCISGSKFLIKGEWYKVTKTLTLLSVDTYVLENHTDIKWNHSYYHKVNFITEQEWREQQLNKLL